MPELGEIRRARDIGLKDAKNRKYIWQACIDCGRQRWVRINRGITPNRIRCPSCSMKIVNANAGNRNTGERNAGWKGGRAYERGYIKIKLRQDNFFFPMADHNGYVREHRLIVAKAIGRCLQPWEVVHHKKGFRKDDNRYPETLELQSDVSHKQLHLWQRKLDNLMKQQGELMKEIRLLRFENKQLKSELVKWYQNRS